MDAKKDKKPTKAELKKQEKQIKQIQEKRKNLTEKLEKKQPAHFKIRDVVHDFFAALIFGLALVFKSDLPHFAKIMSYNHVIAIVVSTILILTGTIYFSGYKGITDKTTKFFWFWLDRLLGHYAIAIIVSAYIIFLFAFNTQVSSPAEVYQMIMILSMPCAIGAAVPNLLKEY